MFSIGVTVPASHTDLSGKVLCRAERCRGLEGGGMAYLEQSSQAIFPVVSLMVRSETNAGYSVSQGSRVCFNFWAVGIGGKKGKECKAQAQYCDWQPTATQNTVLLLLLCDFSSTA